MEVTSDRFTANVRQAIADEGLQEAIGRAIGRFDGHRVAAFEAFAEGAFTLSDGFSELRQTGRPEK